MNFAIIDTETTGLPFHRDAPLDMQPRIIEFGGIITDGEDIFTELEFLCNPHMEFEAKITEITGLKNEDLYDQLDFGEYIGQLAGFFAKADAVIAHNLSFDKMMLLFDLMRRHAELQDINWPSIQICTVEETYHRFGRRVRLEELYNTFVGPYVQKHRATDDAMLLHHVCKAMGVYRAFTAAATC